MIQKLLMWILTPLIKREANKIKNDPEIKAAEEAVKYAMQQYNATAKRSIEIMKAAEKQRDEEHEEIMKTLNKLKGK